MPFSKTHRVLLRIAGVAMAMLGALTWARIVREWERQDFGEVSFFLVSALIVLGHLALGAAVWRGRFLRTALVLEALYGMALTPLYFTIYRIYRMSGMTVPLPGGGTRTLYNREVLMDAVLTMLPFAVANGVAAGLMLYVLVMRRRDRKRNLAFRI